MPEFHLDHGTEHAARFFATLDGFTQGYVEAMFFTESSDSADELSNATFAGLAPETLSKVIGDCEAFQAANVALLATAYAMRADLTDSYDDTMAGRDFWYNRNGHGVGYWDRGLAEIGDKLSDACKAHRSLDLYLGDDGLIYLG